MTAATRLRRVGPADLRALRRDPVPPEIALGAEAIVAEVREDGEAAVLRWAERLGEIAPGAPWIRTRTELDAALARLDAADRAALERLADRIRVFAEAQRGTLSTLEVAIPGGRAGHDVAPVERAGCYAPGGRFPLPSCVLMTAVTARVAGVATVWVASPRPSPETLAAAAIAGADGLAAVGGAHAIAALAFGAGPIPRSDVVVGPGNAWVTAAKRAVLGHCGIDMLAGPSELVVLADAGADPELVAADLLAQAEHDPLAFPVLVTTSPTLLDGVDRALAAQLPRLATRAVAAEALANGLAVVARDLDEAVRACDALAPEHLQLSVERPDEVRARCRHYGAAFVGETSAEVVGDYGAGPNHTLPTGGGARWAGGLSVLHFLRVRTWLRLDSDDPAGAALLDDAARVAAIEGLEGHRAAALRRRFRTGPRKDRLRP